MFAKENLTVNQDIPGIYQFLANVAEFAAIFYFHSGILDFGVFTQDTMSCLSSQEKIGISTCTTVGGGVDMSSPSTGRQETTKQHNQKGIKTDIYNMGNNELCSKAHRKWD